MSKLTFNIFAAAIVAISLGVGSQSFAAFLPDNPALLCRPLSYVGGPTDHVTVEICMVASGGFVSVKGDLIVHVKERSPFKGAVVFDNCLSEFVPAGEFKSKKYQSGGFYLTWHETTTEDFYIIEPQLSLGDRNSWNLWSRNECTWKVEVNDGQDVPSPPDCPNSYEERNSAGICENPIKVYVVPCRTTVC